MGSTRRVSRRHPPAGATSLEPVSPSQNPDEVPVRPIVEGVAPQVDSGRFCVKRIVGEPLRVHAKVFCDGHDRLSAVLRVRGAGGTDWQELPMESVGQDGWEAEVSLPEPGRYEYAVEAWVDRFASWRDALAKKLAARQEVQSEMLEGAELVAAAAARAEGPDADWLREAAAKLRAGTARKGATTLALSEELAACVARHPDRARVARCEPLPLEVERERAAFGAWYELFPRSTSPEPGRHGTLRDCEDRLPYIASMGFDVLYLPPIHPIGVTYRKGRNNALVAAPGDPGSPWAIGSAEGGHQSIPPELGTLADFDRLVARARELGIEIALDIAFQCSPDHPYVQKHLEWFYRRPDGTVQYAENPPKKYQDIYPLNFEAEAWCELWDELASVVLFWVEHGVSIFRVDNPHTKPFAFWEWLIREVRSRHPEVVFLAEAFTRPSVMQYLAKLGFSQSYTYFTWRNTKHEIVRYFEELTATPIREYLRPNLFPNTPDILHEYLQMGGRPAFQTRLTLAATLSASYGIYGPPFELCVAEAVPGTEEYLHSEKYEVRHWQLDDPRSLREYIARINEVRRENPALGPRGRLRFLDVDNEHMLAYARVTPELDDVVIVVVNLDPHHAQAGWIEIPLEELGIDSEQPYQADDLLGGARYLWHGPRSYVALDPAVVPAHVLRVRRRVRTERDFDYYL
jgi:starch synthase (maltosyl-transferring)